MVFRGSRATGRQWSRYGTPWYVEFDETGGILCDRMIPPTEEDGPTGPAEKPSGSKPDSTEAAVVDDLVAECVERMEQDGEQFADQVCDEHPAIARQIREQLSRLRGLGLLRTTKSTPERAPKALGPYTILDEIGRGGMGVVYLAEQREPVRRRVAIKLVRMGGDADSVLRRFQTERQALALMNHPGVARVFDANSDETGRPYFVMEYVAGLPITAYCNNAKLTTDERIELFLQICDAVEHAHQKGILHRDLKPTNILVAEQDGKPLVKVIDFGIAKVTCAELAGSTLITLPGQVVGTPEYMSPEQVSSGGQDIDTRTDVYSLGVLLYELMCGELPFDSKRMRSVSLAEMHSILQAETPKTPSTRTGSGEFAAVRGSNPVTLRRRLRGDLDWIVLRALEPDRERRFSSAQALGDDLRRHLRNEPVWAGPPTLRYRISKLVRRHRVAFAAGTAVAITLAIALVTSMRSVLAAHGKVREFNQLAAFVKVDKAIASQENLLPAWPDKIDGLRSWKARAEQIVAMLPQLRETVEEIRLRPEASSVRNGAQVNFGGEMQGFRRATLFAELTAKIEAFQVAEYRAVVERLWWAERIAAWTAAHPNARRSWQQAREAVAKADGVVASKLYRTIPIELDPLDGLVPIGMNPDTKLWEFYHLRSAWDPQSGVDPGAIEIPTHRPDGSIEVTEATGIIFVLVPGGPFAMGAQNSDPNGRNYDKWARVGERIQLTELEPFLVARHETTQGQWLRMSGHNPSKYYSGKLGDDLTHPVETVRWQECHDLLASHGLCLPSESMWEYACRAGSDTPWYSGPEAHSLRLVANVFDLQGQAKFSFSDTNEKWDDDYVVHAPVGSFAANRFGLFDMHGNVWECCESGPTSGASDTRDSNSAPDGVSARGGGWMHLGEHARSARNHRLPVRYRESDLGVRSARRLVQVDRVEVPR